MLSHTQLRKNAAKMLATKQYKKVVNLVLPTLKTETTPSILGILHGFVGKALYHLEEYTQAIHHLSTALTHLPDEDKLHSTLGLAYFSIRRLESAKNCFEQAISLNPQKEQYFFNLAGTYKHMEQFDLAEKYYRRIIAQNPHTAKAYRNMSLCVQYTDTHHPDRLQLEALLNHPKLSTEEKAQGHFALGKIFRDCHDIEKAFKHYQLGNYFKRQEVEFNHLLYSQKITDIMNLFPYNGFMHPLPQFDSKHSKNPIFIIGIPRSGKTLVEKCLTQHERVLALEEFGVIDKLVFNLGKTHQYNNLFIDLKNDFNTKLILQFVYEYERHIQMHATHDYTAFTDTTPCNFRYLGFIAHMYPNAKIIHVTRDPFDQILQIFYKYFSTGNFWAYAIKDIIHYYNEYQRIMSYWKSVLPIPVKTISYETLVKNPLSTIKKIYEFTELPFSAALMTPFMNHLHDKEIGLSNAYRPYFSVFESSLQKLYK